MKRWIVLTILTAACVPLPYFGGLAAQVAQTAQEQSREEQRQEQQRAAERQWALDRARWLAEQRQQQSEAAQRKWEAAQQEQEQAAARLRWEAAQQQQAETERIQLQAVPYAAEPYTSQPELHSDPTIEQQVSRPLAESAPTQPDPSLADPPDTNARPPLPTDSSAPPVDSASRVVRQQEPAPRSPKKTELRKPKPAARRYEVYQVLMCNDGTESPTCSCGGPRRGCCSHHGGVSGCATQRIPLDQ